MDTVSLFRSFAVAFSGTVLLASILLFLCLGESNTWAAISADGTSLPRWGIRLQHGTDHRHCTGKSLLPAVGLRPDSVVVASQISFGNTVIRSSVEPSGTSRILVPSPLTARPPQHKFLRPAKSTGAATGLRLPSGAGPSPTCRPEKLLLPGRTSSWAHKKVAASCRSRRELAILTMRGNISPLRHSAAHLQFVLPSAGTVRHR